MIPNIKGTDSPIFCIYSTLGTTSYSIFFECCSQAITTLENNVLTLDLVKEHQSTSFFFSIAGNIHQFNLLQRFKALVLLVLYGYCSLIACVKALVQVLYEKYSTKVEVVLRSMRCSQVLYDASRPHLQCYIFLPILVLMHSCL